MHLHDDDETKELENLVAITPFFSHVGWSHEGVLNVEVLYFYS